tara:strand:+ start:149 stop:370 length:222 start_codon:yes stop_codon:yes gene_type:complete
MKKGISFLFRLIIFFYQRTISPFFPATCRYKITCSHYALEAIKKHGPFKGGFLFIKRILTCHPWGGNGHEIVP